MQESETILVWKGMPCESQSSPLQFLPLPSDPWSVKGTGRKAASFSNLVRSLGMQRRIMNFCNAERTKTVTFKCPDDKWLVRLGIFATFLVMVHLYSHMFPKTGKDFFLSSIHNNFKSIQIHVPLPSDETRVARFLGIEESAHSVEKRVLKNTKVNHVEPCRITESCSAYCETIFQPKSPIVTCARK